MCLPFCCTHCLTRLPRPSDPRNPYAAAIWHPPSLHSADSAALRDFGFPSTHSVNAVTNAGMVLMYVAPGHGGLFLCSGPRMCCYLPVCCLLQHVLLLGFLHPRLSVRPWSITAIFAHKSLSPSETSPAHPLLHSLPHNPVSHLFFPLPHRASFPLAARGRHLYHKGSLSFTASPLFTTAAIAAALFHMVALCSSRLFLGVHSVGDVRAGVVRPNPWLMCAVLCAVLDTWLMRAVLCAVLDTWLKCGVLCAVLCGTSTWLMCAVLCAVRDTWLMCAGRLGTTKPIAHVCGALHLVHGE